MVKKGIRKSVITVQADSDCIINDSLIGDRLNINYKRIYPMIVVATMSSGKSTLINALLEDDILPSKNEACTAKAYAILDDDTAEQTKLIVTQRNGSVKTVKENIPEELEKANNDNNVTNILLVGEVKKISNTEKSLMIIDTPGPNNSVDESHEIITTEVLNGVKCGLLVYIINATQIGTEDDARFISYIKEKLSEKPELDIVFVVNKVDEIDFEKETITDIMKNIRDYLENHGFENPDIIPVSALSAKLFTKAIKEKQMTRKEYQNFIAALDFFEPKDNSLSAFSIENGIMRADEYVVVNNKKYSKSHLVAALENTGITFLEQYIQVKQIHNSKHSKISIRKNNTKRG